MRTKIVHCEGRAYYHRWLDVDGRGECEANWEIDPAGFLFARCPHFLILNDIKVRRD